ncbi:threonylcarbamoyl-AMP synthase [Candidatus Acetothermia bacterium]|jgi:L-threonylcarbamoyladenylate synthase|nr:threonylcarbamoyl-AMP synthase [Candidatus Acetothermia bacterium]MCI2427895.1 threonylcarbamoyl-AMP synthase [Candidatus Acetothermia bacterium]MCI2428094.1 threonylcarbamoyl-AMP synthase [Candidatus Acetothermia bacterium]
MNLNAAVKVISVDPLCPDRAILAQAGEMIRQGRLVAFPTETVYGLGADGLSAPAVRRIFVAKGRPADNPLILHIASLNDLPRVACQVPSSAYALAERFWPGPLTLILPRNKTVPAEVSAGLDTVAVRIPAHRVALALINAGRTPIAAPSANRAGRPSPTTAAHVLHDLGERIDLLLDGGETDVGVESTVLDLTVTPPCLLRPGGITIEELKQVIGRVDLIGVEKTDSGPARSPGLKYRHYAPQTPLLLVSGAEMVAKIIALIAQYQGEGRRVGVLAGEENSNYYKEADYLVIIGRRADLLQIAKNLFAGLRRLDAAGMDVLVAEIFDEQGIGVAIMNRLRKAASEII